MCLYHHTFGDFALTIDHDMVVPSIHILLFLATPSFELSPRRSKHGQAQLAIIVDIDISKVQSSWNVLEGIYHSESAMQTSFQEKQ